MSTAASLHIYPGTPHPTTHTTLSMWQASWRQALDHLSAALVNLRQQVNTDDMTENLAEVEATMLQDMSLYTHCLATAREEHTLARLQRDAEPLLREVRFYRLAVVLSQSYLECCEHTARVELVSGSDEKQAWTSMRWLEELRRSTLSAQQQLAA